LFTVSVAAFRSLHASDAHAMAGHSVGEYAALVCSGACSLEDGARLVQRRGDLMARAGTLRPGTMAAVLGMEEDAVSDVCATVSSADACVVVANFNSPGQVVISGDVSAVSRACEELKSQGAKRCIPLNVSGAFHSPLMEDAADAMSEALRRVTFQVGNCPVVSNVTAEPGEDWATLLTKQLKSPVLWTQSVRKMLEMGVEEFVECGPGDVLCGLMKRIAADARCASYSAMREAGRA
jgi:[acyl-carrier-protein] S-malonyltransferase